MMLLVGAACTLQSSSLVPPSCVQPTMFGLKNVLVVGLYLLPDSSFVCPDVLASDIF